MGTLKSITVGVQDFMIFTKGPAIREHDLCDVSLFAPGGGGSGDYTYGGYTGNFGFCYGKWGGNWQGQMTGGMNDFGGWYGSFDGSYNPGYGSGYWTGTAGYDSGMGWNAGATYHGNGYNVNVGFNTGGSTQGGYIGVTGTITF